MDMVPTYICLSDVGRYIVPVFTVKELEKHPDAGAGAAAARVAELPAAGAREPLSGDELELAQTALLRVRAAVTERSLDLRPAFADHDE